MNILSIKGNWSELAGKLKQKYADLTDDDVLLIEGKEEEMLGRLQMKLGKSKEDVHNIIEDMQRKRPPCAPKNIPDLNVRSRWGE